MREAKGENPSDQALAMWQIWAIKNWLDTVIINGVFVPHAGYSTKSELSPKKSTRSGTSFMVISITCVIVSLTLI